MSDGTFDAATYYRRALAPEDRARLPYYAHLVDALANSPTAVALLGEARPEQRNPMLVLACLHYGALRGDRDLAPLYEQLTSYAPAQFAARVTAVLEARPELVRAQLWRATQTNEPGRSAVLAAVLSELHGRGVTDVHLIDVGTSMGLNLYPDYYRINVDETDDVVLRMEDLNANAATSPLPRIHERIGIDLNPLDPEDPDDVRWLKACLWPEEPARARRLDAILEQMVLWPRATRLKGSALELIDVALERCSPDATPVIFHSWVAAYFSREEQALWRERIMRHVRTRATWVYFEHPWGVKGLDPPARPDEPPRAGATQLVVCEIGADPAHWGWAHPHGRWVALTVPKTPRAHS